MTKFPKDFHPVGLPPIPNFELERLLDSEAQRLSTILDVSVIDARRTLRNLVNKGLIK